MTHTPTPWFAKELHSNYEGYVLTHVEEHGTAKLTKRVDWTKAGQFKKEDAAHIVRCVNTHDTLVEALHQLLRAVNDLVEDGTLDASIVHQHTDYVRAVKALALAENGA